MTLMKFEITWAEAAMGAIFPGSRDEGLDGICEMDLRGFLAQVMKTVPLQAAFGLRLAVWIVALAPVFIVGRLATIARLDQKDRERVIATLLANRHYAVRSIVLILKTIGALLFAGNDAVRARMNRPTPTTPKDALVPLRIKRAQVA
jgi:hypothetical protein